MVDHTERNAEIIRRYNAGETCPAIARSIRELTENGVESILKRARAAGLIVRPGNAANVERDRAIVERWNTTEDTGDQIAAHFGIGKSAVHHALRRARKLGWHVVKRGPVSAAQRTSRAQRQSFGRAVAQAYARKHHPQTKGVSETDRALIDAWLKKRKPTKCPRGYADFATQPQYIQSTSRHGVQISVAP